MKKGYKHLTAAAKRRIAKLTPNMSQHDIATLLGIHRNTVLSGAKEIGFDCTAGASIYGRHSRLARRRFIAREDGEGLGHNRLGSPVRSGTEWPAARQASCATDKRCEDESGHGRHIKWDLLRHRNFPAERLLLQKDDEVDP